MNTEWLFFVIPGLTVFLFIMGLYKTTLEKQVKAQENIQELLGGTAATASNKSALQLQLHQKRYQETQLLKKKKKKPDKPAKGPFATLDTDLERANVLLRSNEFILISVATTVVVFFMVAFLLRQNLFIGILSGVGGFFLPITYLKLRVMLRMGKAAEQFPDVLDALVNCFKTGYAFSRALQVIADNFDDPWGTEFGKLVVEMNLGASQESVLLGLTQRVPSPDVDLFVTAVIIQKETGGNLAELLKNLSSTCRERFKLKRKVSSVSAQGKLSAGIIACVPLFLMGMMFLFLHDPVIEFVTNPIGIVLLVITGGWMLMGFGVLYKIVNIEV